MSGSSGPVSKRPRHDKESRERPDRGEKSERGERGGNAPPSRVLYLSNLPRNCNENDLANIMGQFGPITCVQLMRGGREALIEYTDMKIAADVIKTANKKVFNIGPNVVRLEYSNSQSIRRRDSGTMPGMGGSLSSRDMRMMEQSMMQRQNSIRGQEPTRVLHLDIANAQYPINAEVIYTICSINGREGRVNRICCGKMNPDESIEVLVEFASVMDAQKVYEQLNGADIYSGCCTLNISFSKLNRVVVLKNDEMSYDYTTSNPGRGGLLGSQPPSSMLGQGGMMGGHGRMMNSGGMSLIQQQMSLQQGGGQSLGMRHGGMERDLFPDQMMMQGGMGGRGYGHGPDRRDRGSDGGMGMRMNMGMSMGMRRRGLDGSMESGMMHDDDGFVPFETGEGVVVMFYNLDERTNCNHLFNLCCLYGNVARIKFLKSRPDCAMVQMGNRIASTLVIQHFNGVTLFGKKIEVSRSKQIEIVEQSKPLKLPDGTESSKNFMSDMNNRFRNSYLASQCKIVAPNNTVHFFNAPRHFTTEDMNDLFEKSQAPKPKMVAVFPVKDNAKTSLGEYTGRTILIQHMSNLYLSNNSFN